MKHSTPHAPVSAAISPSSAPSANEELAAEITAALLINKLVAPEDEARAKTLLTAGNVKTGEWRTLLEKPLFSPSATTATDSDDATSHNPA